MCGRSCRSQSLGRQRVGLCHHSTEISRWHLRRHKWWDTAAAPAAGSSWRDLDGGIRGQQPHREGVSRDLQSGKNKDTSSCCKSPRREGRGALSPHHNTHTLPREAEVPLCCHHIIPAPTRTGEVKAQLLTQQGKTRWKREKRCQKNSLS